MASQIQARLALALASALVASSGFVAASPMPVHAAAPGANGRIAWQRDDIGGSHVWTMRADGTDKVDIGPGAWPSWSADGSHLGYSELNGGIVVVEPDGSNLVHLDGGGLLGSWSPDGSRIAFAGFDTSNYDIYVVNADGSGKVNITNNPSEDIDPSWSPDGSKIAFRTNRDGTSAIYTVDPDGSNPTNLTPGGNGNEPDWSPDGTRIAFSNVGIWVMKADGSDKARLRPTGMEPAWSPDGTSIAFADSPEDTIELFAMAADGTQVRRLTNDTGSSRPDDLLPSWQPTAFTLAPGSLAYGDGAIGVPGAAKAITLTAGVDPLSVTSVAPGGPAAGDFAIVADACSGTTLPAHATCTVSVRFAATATGPRSGTLDFTGPGPLGTASVALGGFGRLFLWGGTHNAGPAYTFNEGNALARATGSTSYLHATLTTPRIGSKWATDRGPYVAVEYIRSSNGGTTWTAAKRLNPTNQHGSRTAVAASGRYVYVAWVSTTKWNHYKGSAPRVLYLRRNTSNGAGSAWKARVRLTSKTGRVDYPTVASNGASVYVAYTDSKTGAVMLAVSRDHGATWRKVKVGTTAKSTSSGRFGVPQVAVSGNSVAVAWVADNANTVKVRLSTNAGSTWGAATTLGATTTAPHIAVAGNRVAVAWSSDGIKVRVATSGAWDAVRALPQTDGHASETQLSPAIALQGPTHLAVAYTACLADCFASDPDILSRTDLIWRESGDNGATWAPSDVVASSATTAKRRSNDTPSIAWPSARRPFVLWNGWNDATLDFRLYVRAGV